MYILGIHPDGDYFKVALLCSSGKKIRIHFLQEFKKDILDLNQLKRKILKTESVEVVSALTPEEVFVKKVSFPFTKESAVMKALPFQMEKILPFSEEHVTTVTQVRKGKKESEVTLYTFFNETLQNHLQEIKTLGFDPDAVSMVARGLLSFKNFFAGEESGAALIYFGWERSYLVYADKEEVRHSLVLEVGFRELIDSVRDDYPEEENIDYPFLRGEIGRYFRKELGSGLAKGVIEKLQKGLFRAFEYIKKKENLSELNVLHLGYSAISEEMCAMMSEIPMRVIDIVPHLEFDKQQIRSYAIEIGIALEYLDKKALQLRVGEFVSSKQVGKLERKMKTLLTLSVVSSVALFGWISACFVKKEGVLRERFNYVASLKGGGEIDKVVFSPEHLQKKIDGVLAKGKQNEPLRVTECLHALAQVDVIEIKYEPYKLEVEFRAPSSEEAKKSFEKVLKKIEVVPLQKGLDRVKESDVYQISIVFKERG